MDRRRTSYYQEAKILAHASPGRAIAELRRLHDRRDPRRYIMMDVISLTVDNIDVFSDWVKAGYDGLAIGIASDASIYPAAGTPRDRRAEVSDEKGSQQVRS